jgi:tetratricopeptide (TPR) repeat protein
MGISEHVVPADPDTGATDACGDASAAVPPPGETIPAQLLDEALALRDRTGDPAAASALIARARILAERTGTDPGELADVLVVEGELYRDLGDLERADRTLRRAAAVADGLPDSPEAAWLRVRARTVLGGVHRAQGRHTKAVRMLRRTLELAETRFGPDSAEVVAVLNELAVAFAHVGDLAEAEQLYLTTLGILERTVGPDHPEVATVHRNLGELACAFGDLAVAEALTRSAIAIREGSLGPGHATVADDRAALAAILVEMGRHEEAEALLREVLAVVERVHGPEHLEAGFVLHNLAAAVQQRGNLAEAESLYRRALAIKEAALGPGHPDLAPTLHNLAAVCAALGTRAEAERLLHRSRAVLGGTTPR